MKPCYCEHIAHDHELSPRELTPNGNPSHYYGKEFDDSYIVEVDTCFGKFEVCKDCAKDCYHPEHLKEIGCAPEGKGDPMGTRYILHSEGEEPLEVDLEEFIRENNLDEDEPEVASDLRALQSRQSYFGGCGAQPEWSIRCEVDR